VRCVWATFFKILQTLVDGELAMSSTAIGANSFAEDATRLQIPSNRSAAVSSGTFFNERS
jgi:hypothetical protein